MAQNKITRRWGIIGAGASTEAETTKSVTRSEDLSGELLPGIPNDVALEEIAPKLSLGDVRLLYEACPIWREAIRGHLVYDARVRSHATLECFVFIIDNRGRSHRFDTIIVYSPSDKCWYKLPRTAGLPTGSIDYCHHLSLNGAIYLLDDDSGNPGLSMLDLAGQQSRWRPCANMLEARIGSAVSVMDGKIFVFGGETYSRFIRRCEAYDPTVDAWSKIKPMISLGHTLNVVAVGKELFVYGYYTDYADTDDDAEDELLDRDETRLVDDAADDADTDDDAEDELLDRDETRLVDDAADDADTDDDAEDELLDRDENKLVDYAAEDADTDEDAKDELLDRDETRLVDDAEKQLVNLNERRLAEERLVDLDESLAEERLVRGDETLEDKLVEKFCRTGYRTTEQRAEMRRAEFVEAYDPIKDEWRVAEFWEVNLDEILLPEQKKAYEVMPCGNGIVWKMSL